MTALIDLNCDKLVPVAKLVQQRFGRRISPPTLWRWRTRGIRGVRLEAYFVAGQWCSTPAALTEFLRRSAEAAMPQSDRPSDAPRMFGDADYSREELVAEMGAAFLSGHAGIESATLDTSAA